VSRIHVADEFADHVQSRFVLTGTEPFPPCEGKEALLPAIVTWHLSSEGPDMDEVFVLPQAHSATNNGTIASAGPGARLRSASISTSVMHVPRQRENSTENPSRSKFSGA
jgi:hypothetical protein